MPRKKEKVGAPPGWMTTMSDMNTLLMVFFIMLFSMLSWEPASKFRLGEELVQSGLPEGTESVLVTPTELAGTSISRLASFLESTAARQATLQIQGTFARVALAPEGIVLSVGGEFEPFDEGEFRLKPSHHVVIDEIFRMLKDRPNRIIIRGYTAPIRPDSLVKDKDAETWRPWMPADGETDKADWHMLAYLRAEEAARYLMQPRTGQGRIGPERIVIQPEGPFGARLARLPSLLKPGAKLDIREGELIPEAYVRQALSEMRKDRRIDIVVLPEGS